MAARAFRVPPLRATAIVAVLSGALFAPVDLLAFEPRLTVAPPGEVLFHAAYQGLLVTIVALLGETPSMPEEVTGLALVTAGMLTAIVPRPNDGGR